MVNLENVATRGFLHSTSRVGITDHNATRLDDCARPLPYLLASVTPIFFHMERLSLSACDRPPLRHTCARSAAAGRGVTVGHRPSEHSRPAAASQPLAALGGASMRPFHALSGQQRAQRRCRPQMRSRWPSRWPRPQL